jgi:hypothetical protein
MDKATTEPDSANADQADADGPTTVPDQSASDSPTPTSDAAATTAPSGGSTAAASADTATTGESTTAASTPSGSFPTPAELIAKLKEQDQEVASQPKVAFFDLSDPIVEKPADFSLFANNINAGTLLNLLDRMETARKDKDVRAVLLTLGDAGMNLAQAQEVRDKLIALRQAGKRTFVYADAYDTDTYVVAAANWKCPASGSRPCSPKACSTNSASRPITCRSANTRAPTKSSPAPNPAKNFAANSIASWTIFITRSLTASP